MEHARRHRPAATAMWLRALADRLAVEPMPDPIPAVSDDPEHAQEREREAAQKVSRIVDRVMSRAMKEAALSPRSVAAGLLGCAVEFGAKAMGRRRALEWAADTVAEALAAADEPDGGAPGSAPARYDA